MEINDKKLEDLLQIVGAHVMGEIEEIVPFESKTEEEREEIFKLLMRATEVATIVNLKYLKDDQFDWAEIEKDLAKLRS